MRRCELNGVSCLIQRCRIESAVSGIAFGYVMVCGNINNAGQRLQGRTTLNRDGDRRVAHSLAPEGVDVETTDRERPRGRIGIRQSPILGAMFQLSTLPE